MTTTAIGGNKKPDADANRLSVESKESSYMGFDRGIDSDIEMEQANPPNSVGANPLTNPAVTICVDADAPGGTNCDAIASRCSSEPHLKKKIGLTPKLARWESLDPPDSDGSQTLVAPEDSPATSAKNNSVSKCKRNDKGQGSDNSKSGSTMPMNDIQKVNSNHKSVGPGTANLSPIEVPSTIITTVPNTTGGSFTSIGTQSVVLTKYHSHRRQKYSSDSLLIMLSGIYAKLLIVMGICFPLAEVISKRIPITYYEGFYLYLYLGSISFLLFLYIFILRNQSPKKSVTCKSRILSCFRSLSRPKSSISDCSSSRNSSSKSLNQLPKEENKPYEATNCGNFYLRLGAVAFGIASMIYSGLEFGQFFEMNVQSSCYNILHGVTPTARMAFTFIQMYFIFLNSRVCIKKYKAIARFGLMHMIATNLCVWLHVLVQETKHGILTLINVNFTLPMTSAVPLNMIAEVVNDENFTDYFMDDSVNSSRVYRSIHERIMSVSYECKRSNIMGELVQEASRFLFPCTIQYSLICSAILYIMWKNIGKNAPVKIIDNTSSHSTMNTHQQQYQQVDCAKANKGLFTGILILVLSIISIILFFVLIGKPEYKIVAIMEARVTELALYLMTSMAVAVALLQVREMKYNSRHDTELDHILLIVAQSGLYLFTMFSIIGGHFTEDQNTLLVLVTSLACIIQATLQTIFILDASRCHVATVDQLRRKPGRELVTFLLVCNFAMWAMNTLQTQRADSNPIQLQFYGFWAWTIITHVTTPLAIYFRFHSTVCLCAIWKKTYKMRPDYV